MKEITKTDIENLAKLVRIGLTDGEKKTLAGEMTAILEYVRQLDEVDVSSVEPTTQVTGLKNVVRIDEVVRSVIKKDELLNNTPDVENGFIKVKSVL